MNRQEKNAQSFNLEEPELSRTMAKVKVRVKKLLDEHLREFYKEKNEDEDIPEELKDFNIRDYV